MRFNQHDSTGQSEKSSCGQIYQRETTAIYSPVTHYWNMFSGAFGQLTAADQSGVEEDEKDDLVSMSKTSNSKNLSGI